MGAARGGLDRLPERSRAVARRPQAGRARGRGVRRGGACRRQGRDGAAGRSPRGRSGNARAQLAPFAEVIVEPFGDIWLRDTGPIVVGSGKSRPRRRASASTAGAANTILKATRTSASGSPGSAGTALRQGRLGARRRSDRRRRLGHGRHHRAVPAQSQPQRADPRRGRSSACSDDLGFERVVWLGAGLMNDHTDGHVDNLARFVAPGRVAIPTRGQGRSQRGGLSRRRAAACVRPGSTSSPCPRPGAIPDEDGDVIPASYMNFYIGNAVVVVPQYGAAERPRRRSTSSRPCSPTALQSAFAPTTS